VLILNRPFPSSGMNDVLNSQGYTQAAWWNRIPIAAWILMIAALSNVLLGYGMHGKFTVLSVILPLAVSISFFLIADIDSPRGGVIRILPRNLYALADSLTDLSRSPSLSWPSGFRNLFSCLLSN
jgi:hypothetical protein